MFGIMPTPLVILMYCIGIIQGNTTTNPLHVHDKESNSCDLSRLDDRFRSLENHILTKVDVLRNDIRESSRKIQNLEYQNSGIRNSVDECKNDIRRLLERNHHLLRRQNPQNTQSECPALDNNKLEDFDKRIQLTIATVRLLDADISQLTRNISDLSNITNNILGQVGIQSNIDQIFQKPPNHPLIDPASAPREISHPKNCKEIKEIHPNANSGIYLVRPESSQKPFAVFCEMKTSHGGWLVVHNRYEGSHDFYLGWEDYKVGFGNVAGEHWLGLEKVHQLTDSQVNELLVELVDVDENRKFAYYAYFGIGTEEEGYHLKVLGSYQGTAGDSLSYHAGSKFSTKDRDQDGWLEGHCAQSHGGAWWYKSCDASNLNGRYVPGTLPENFQYQGMYWGEFRGAQEGLLQARMMIRPRNFFDVPDEMS